MSGQERPVAFGRGYLSDKRACGSSELRSYLVTDKRTKRCTSIFSSPLTAPNCRTWRSAVSRPCEGCECKDNGNHRHNSVSRHRHEFGDTHRYGGYLQETHYRANSETPETGRRARGAGVSCAVIHVSTSILTAPSSMRQRRTAVTWSQWPRMADTASRPSCLAA